jgi:hypothetical protein
MAGTNIDPHDLCTAPAGEDLSQKQFYMVEFNGEGEMVLAAAKHRAFSLFNNPKAGESATFVVPCQTKGVLGGTVKPGYPLAVNAEGKLVHATEAEQLIVGIALSEGASGDLCTFSAIVAGGAG